MTARRLSPLELNHLHRHGFTNLDLTAIGEKPVEYLTGHADFCGLDFLVNQSTLIPRLESEKIVQLGLNHLLSHHFSHPVIADIGTGSGCLGLSLAVSLAQKQIPYTIFLADLSPAALSVARENTSRLLTSPANIFFEQSDLLTRFPAVKFDLLVANLPYIPSHNLSSLDASVKDFEPLSALDGGPDGTTLINRLLQSLPSFLSEQGLAILEIDDTHSLHHFTLPSELTAVIDQDLYQRPRFLLVRFKNNTPLG